MQLSAKGVLYMHGYLKLKSWTQFCLSTRNLLALTFVMY